jgi:hypothetical protein
VTLAQDVFGNIVAIATFQTMADNLSIHNVAELELNAVAWPVFDIAGAAIFFPLQYSDDQWADLGALTIQQYPDPAGRAARPVRFPGQKLMVRQCIGPSPDRLSAWRDLRHQIVVPQACPKTRNWSKLAARGVF